MRRYLLRAQGSFKSCPRVGGIRQRGRRRQPGACGFKSCPRVGGIDAQAGRDRGAVVSSRAPVWGASRSQATEKLVTESFKSCPRVGGIIPASPG